MPRSETVAVDSQRRTRLKKIDQQPFRQREVEQRPDDQYPEDEYNEDDLEHNLEDSRYRELAGIQQPMRSSHYGENVSYQVARPYSRQFKLVEDPISKQKSAAPEPPSRLSPASLNLSSSEYRLLMTKPTDAEIEAASEIFMRLSFQTGEEKNRARLFKGVVVARAMKAEPR